MSDNSARRDAALKNLDKELKSRSRREKMRPLGVVLATVVVLVVIVGSIWFAVTRDDSSDTVAEETTSDVATPTAVAMVDAPLEAYPDTVTCEYPESGEASKEVTTPDTENIPTSGTVNVTLSTNMGDIPLVLDRSKSPCTVNAIEHFVSSGYYDDTVCHRVVVAETMKILQCGDPTGTGTGGPGFTFADEYPSNAYDEADAENPVIYPRGTLAMANGGADTNGSQMFLVDDDTTLAPSYNVFGTVTEDGLVVLDSIIAENADANQDNGGDGAPVTEVRITSATVDA
ncbi:peptidylprolyl isomerase [Corynebacterium terpenotabidum]|uniref:Peptidyl-prolyl cis-trans isomerase n=1 Tax=Corynebacterium terpenotabidum Y-11 TaxID=1200352 RepID=S4XGT5_9CORY|nr:peptidylprolyl isomerase [Corynebacterium terpenotabidum]AGP30865.1 peptidyl-prolyl cis-trans isomerase [Corynebacterium terpenotabidum Y-11]